jgi:hypothetical protein
MIVRTLRDDEPMPQHLRTGFEAMQVDRQWAWVAEKDGQIIGILLAGSCHGLIYLMRLCVKKGSSPMVVRALIEKTRQDCSARGFKGYFFHLDPTVDQKLLRACRKYGGLQLQTPQVILVGSLERKQRCHPL